MDKVLVVDVKKQTKVYRDITAEEQIQRTALQATAEIEHVEQEQHDEYDKEQQVIKDVKFKDWKKDKGY